MLYSANAESDSLLKNIHEVNFSSEDKKSGFIPVMKLPTYFSGVEWMLYQNQNSLLSDKTISVLY